MKLTDGWIARFLRYEKDRLPEVETLAEADGVMFVCPKCARPSDLDPGKMSGHPVICWFVGRVPDDAVPGPGRWTPSGTGLSDLTLRPSVQLGPGCSWHGWVTNGEAA